MCNSNRVRYSAGGTAGEIYHGTVHGGRDQLGVAADPVRAQPKEAHLNYQFCCAV